MIYNIRNPEHKLSNTRGARELIWIQTLQQADLAGQINTKKKRILTPRDLVFADKF